MLHNDQKNAIFYKSGKHNDYGHFVKMLLLFTDSRICFFKVWSLLIIFKVVAPKTGLLVAAKQVQKQ